MSSSRQGAHIQEQLLECLWPTRCGGCECPGVLLCEDCREALPFIEQDSACPRCGAPYGAVVCTECENQWGSIHYAFEQGVSVCRLDGVASRLLVLYKDSNERRLSAVLAELMAAACPPQWLQWAELLAFVPCDGAALERRGFDHMERLAGDFSRLSGLPLAPLLAKQAGVDQRGLSRQRRFVNQRSAFSLQPDVTAADLFGRRILLLDDVMTTGATLDAAAVLLRASGAAAVRALTFCRTW